MHSVNIVSPGTTGLNADARIVARLLAAHGIEARIYKSLRRNGFGLAARLALKARALSGAVPDATIFMERIDPQWLRAARRNVIVPNQEWCRPETVALLPRMDAVLCKTEAAQAIFSDLGYPAVHVGFSSDDRYDPAIPRSRRFLHLAGYNVQKGTRVLLDLWRAHPEWPELVVVAWQDDIGPNDKNLPNVTLIGTSQSQAQTAVLQNQCAIHLCPSEAEGFGHAICEGLACAAGVLVTDAPPMNELVTPDHGVLAAWRESAPKRLGTEYKVDPAALEAAVERILAMDAEELRQRGERARTFYLARRAAFEQRFISAWRAL